MSRLSSHHQHVFKQARRTGIPPVAVLACSPDEFFAFIHMQPEHSRQYVYVDDRWDIHGVAFSACIRLPGWWQRRIDSRAADELESMLAIKIIQYLDRSAG